MIVRRVVGWCLVVALSLVFLAAGAAKFRAPAWQEKFEAWGYPAWVWAGVGIAEIACAILLFVPRSRRWAALALAAIMAGAAATHLWHAELPRIAVNAALAGMSLAVLRIAPGKSRREKEAE